MLRGLPSNKGFDDGGGDVGDGGHCVSGAEDVEVDFVVEDVVMHGS